MVAAKPERRSTRTAGERKCPLPLRQWSAGRFVGNLTCNDKFCHAQVCRDKLGLMNKADPMTTMNISLPESLRTFVEQRAATGYGSASEYIRTLLREAQMRSTQSHLEQLLLEGLNSGPSESWTADDWAELRRHIRTTAAKKLGARETKD